MIAVQSTLLLYHPRTQKSNLHHHWSAASPPESMKTMSLCCVYQGYDKILETTNWTPVQQELLTYFPSKIGS